MKKILSILIIIAMMLVASVSVSADGESIDAGNQAQGDIEVNESNVVKDESGKVVSAETITYNLEDPTRSLSVNYKTVEERADTNNTAYNTLAQVVVNKSEVTSSTTLVPVTNWYDGTNRTEEIISVSNYADIPSGAEMTKFYEVEVQVIVNEVPQDEVTHGSVRMTFQNDIYKSSDNYEVIADKCGVIHYLTKDETGGNYEYLKADSVDTATGEITVTLPSTSPIAFVVTTVSKNSGGSSGSSSGKAQKTVVNTYAGY